jgi:hypothetical protein
MHFSSNQHLEFHMPTVSDFHKTNLRSTYPSLLPVSVIQKIDRLIVPKRTFWIGVHQTLKRLVQSAFAVALLPMLAVMADPVFSGSFLGGAVLSFEQYQRFLQSSLFWGMTFVFAGLAAICSRYFDRLAIHVRDRQREHERTAFLTDAANKVFSDKD